MTRDELNTEFDRLSSEIEARQRECNRTYAAWQEACRQFELNSADRHRIWMALIDSSTHAYDIEKEKA
jgi:hypothetical protein